MPFCRATLSAKAFHRRRWWTNSRVTADHAAEQRRSSGASAFRELVDDALSDIAHGVNRANHLLLADHDLVERCSSRSVAVIALTPMFREARFTSVRGMPLL